MFVWVLEGKAADPGEIGFQLGHWTNQFGETPGYLGATGGVTDDRRFLMFVRWESEDAGDALLMRPEQVDWYEEFQQSFDGTVEFVETGDVTTQLAGGPMPPVSYRRSRSQASTAERVEAADREVREHRTPGPARFDRRIRVWTAPDGFVGANYFTSEHDARAGEKQSPARVRRTLRRLHGDDERRRVLRLHRTLHPHPVRPLARTRRAGQQQRLFDPAWPAEPLRTGQSGQLDESYGLLHPKRPRHPRGRCRCRSWERHRGRSRQWRW